MKYMVLGGAGFIGSHIVDELIKAGHKVVVVDNLSGGYSRNVNSEARLEIVDITDVMGLDSVFRRLKPDYVIHAAAYAAEGLSHFIRRFNYTNNVVGSANVINCAIKYKVRSFVFLSSVAVYGDSEVMTEDTCPAPIDPYGIAKLAIEMDLQAAHKQFGLNYVIWRLHNVYGERQNLNDKYRNVVGIFIRKKLLGEPITIFGDGEQERSFTYIEDIASILASSAQNRKFRNKVFNLGANAKYSVDNLATYLEISSRVYVEARNEVKYTNPDHTKVRKIIRVFESPLNIGLMNTMAWAEENQKEVLGKVKNFSQIELTQGLPESW